MRLKVKIKGMETHIYDADTGREIQDIIRADIKIFPGKPPRIFLELSGVDLKLDIKGDGEIDHPERATTQDGEVWLRAKTLAAQVRAIAKEVPLGSQKAYEVRYSENLLKSWEGIDPDHDSKENPTS